MKKLLTGSLMFALAAGAAVCAIVALSQPASADYCILAPSSFVYYGSECKPEPGTQQVGKFDYVTKYSCLGHSATTGLPCLCTYLGCVRDPYHLPPDPVDE